MAIRAILYDNDGTLVDTHDLILSSMKHTVSTVLGRHSIRSCWNSPMATSSWEPNLRACTASITMQCTMAPSSCFQVSNRACAT